VPAMLSQNLRPHHVGYNLTHVPAPVSHGVRSCAARGRRHATMKSIRAGRPASTLSRAAVLSAEIQTSMSPAPVDPSIVHDHADPGTGDRRVVEIDVFPDQTLRALAACVNQPLACAGVPVEQQIDAMLPPDFRGSAARQRPRSGTAAEQDDPRREKLEDGNERERQPIIGRGVADGADDGGRVCEDALIDGDNEGHHRDDIRARELFLHDQGQRSNVHSV
jgi:hypothetical protein